MNTMPIAAGIAYCLDVVGDWSDTQVFFLGHSRVLGYILKALQFWFYRIVVNTI